MKAFKVTKDGLVAAGTVIYPYPSYDHGLANDDSVALGHPFKSMTDKPFGRGPFFTVAERDMVEVEVEDIELVDHAHAHEVCKMGQGQDCCRYLTVGANGFSCEKLSPMGDSIERRVDTMKAQGDNCDGRASR